MPLQEMRFLSHIICCLVLLVDLKTVAGKTCGNDEYKVSLVVRTRFWQESVVSAYTYTEKITSSETFKKKLSTEDFISGNYGSFSARASDAITDFVQSNKNNSKDVNIYKISFNEDFLGIFQEIVTEIIIDDETATKTETKFVKPVPVTNPWSSKKLREDAEAYMDWLFPEGSQRNTFTETVCRKRVTCGEDEYKVSLVVSARLWQKSVASAFTYSEKITSSKTFKKKLEELPTDDSNSGRYGAFSASASASITEFDQSNKNNAKDVNKDKISFNKDFLGIFQEVVTKIIIDGETATKTETKFVKPVPVANPWSSKKLIEEAGAYMDWLFPEGSKRNTFTESVCMKKGKDKLGLSCS